MSAGTAGRAVIFAAGAAVGGWLSTAPARAAAPPPSIVNGISTESYTAQNGWVGDYVTYAADTPPTGSWDFQYANAFAAVPVAGPGYTTWSSVAKPAAADWPLAVITPYSGTYAYSDPARRMDTSKQGSQAYNSAYVYYYKGLTGYFAYESTLSEAKSNNAADDPATASTRVRDPWTIAQPSSGDWSIGGSYVQIGAFTDAQAGSTISDQQSITLEPSATLGVATTFDLVSIDIAADGTVVVQTDLNGNDASQTKTLAPGLNGFLMLDGTPVTTGEAEADLEKLYSPATGWDLADGTDPSDLDLSDPAAVDQVFDLQTVVFLDNATASAVISTVDGATAVSAVPEPGGWILLVTGISAAGLQARRRRLAIV